MILLGQGKHHVLNGSTSEAQMISSNFQRPFVYQSSFSKQRSKVENKLLAAKKHSEAERRRRTRINGQYDTLRNVLPNIIKKDKATVLVETIKQLKELKKKVSKLEEENLGTSKEVKFPRGGDKLNLEKCNDEQGLLVTATLSCEDRPGLMSAMARSIGSMNAKVVKTEMVTVGGRTRSLFWVQGLGNESLGTLKSNLKVVIHKPTFKMRQFSSQ